MRPNCSAGTPGWSTFPASASTRSAPLCKGWSAGSPTPACRGTVAAIDHHLGKGETARARRIAAAMLDDPAVLDEPVVLTRCLMLLPLARAGEWELASLTFRRLRRAMSGEFHSAEHIGYVIEFCALTGNALTGIDWLPAAAGFEARQRPFATMELAASVAVLAAALVRAGRGDTVFDLGPRLALDLAGQFDRRNGNTVHGDRIRARLAAEPLTGFSPLEPTSRPPLRLLPPPGLSDEALLTRAEWHDLRCEADEARACLTVVSDDLPPHLDARLAELRAKFLPGEETEPALRHAIDVHRRYGDQARALLAECWLGLWTAHAGRPDDGVAAAVEQLRGLGDDSHCAWGEHTGTLDALIAADAPEKALTALEQLTRHDGYLEVVEKILSDPPRDAARLVGRLRYLRACASPGTRNAADIADDLADGDGTLAAQAFVTGTALPEQPGNTAPVEQRGHDGRSQPPGGR